jgi:hypothetical protein
MTEDKKTTEGEETGQPDPPAPATIPVPDVAETVPPHDGVNPDLMEQAEAIADGLLSDPAMLSQILSMPMAEGSEDGGTPESKVDPAVLEAMSEFKFGTSVPLAGQLHASYAFKYALDDENVIVWDLLLSPLPFEEALTKFPLVYETAFGPVNELGYLPWYKIVGMTYDEGNKRVVPVKLLMMSPSFAFKDVSAVALSKNITTSMILETIDAVETHRSLVVGEEARTAKKEAKTYKDIVDRIFTIDYSESVEDMLGKAKEADDKGDQAMASAFKVQRDFWTTMRENWCWVALVLAIIGAVILQNMGVIG